MSLQGTYHGPSCSGEVPRGRRQSDAPRLQQAAALEGLQTRQIGATLLLKTFFFFFGGGSFSVGFWSFPFFLFILECFGVIFPLVLGVFHFFFGGFSSTFTHRVVLNWPTPLPKIGFPCFSPRSSFLTTAWVIHKAPSKTPSLRVDGWSTQQPIQWLSTISRFDLPSSVEELQGGGAGAFSFLRWDRKRLAGFVRKDLDKNLGISENLTWEHPHLMIETAEKILWPQNVTCC